MQHIRHFLARAGSEGGGLESIESRGRLEGEMRLGGSEGGEGSCSERPVGASLSGPTKRGILEAAQTLSETLGQSAVARRIVCCHGCEGAAPRDNTAESVRN